MTQPETFRCRVYQAERHGPFTRSELLDYIDVTGNYQVVFAEQHSPQFQATHVCEQPRLGHTFRLLNSMVRKGILKRTDFTRPLDSKGPFGESPEQQVAKFERT